MRNLFRFIHRNHLIFLFIFLEILSFIFIFNFNNYQKVRFLNSSSSLTAGVYERYSKVTDFFGLPSVNRELAEENAKVTGYPRIESPSRRIPESMLIRYSGMDQQYGFIPARIINITVNRQQNYFTINKGSKDGVKPDMGVITVDGVAGVITNVTANYATGLTLLNTRWNVSAMLKKNNYFGTLAWDGKNYQKAMLNEIPFHVNVAVGDTIITSGYSSLFPTGIMLGTVESFNKGGGENFYTIRVNLSVDFKSISYVEVIQNNKRTEIENIQKLIGTDENLD